MSRRPKNSQSVALFPFLAVLVCTMGALIFLLLVTTRMIRDRATSKALARAAAPIAAAPQLPLLSVAPPEQVHVPSPSIVVPAESEELPEPTVDVRAMALEQRQRELEALAAQWQGRLDELSASRAERSRLLAQRQQLQKGAAQRIAAMQSELKELEIKLGKMTGELSATATGTGTVEERIELETQIRELKRRLRAAPPPQTDEKFEVVPFDVISGTSRRPILIECTATGLKFIPEDVTVSPNDLVGFSPHVNPLIVGANALVNYWTAWNLRQPNPRREPEPYVLLLVRPNGTIAYYVAMKMLSELKQPHGYELLEEDTVLQLPPVDAGAKAACEAAVNRLVAERNQVLRQAGAGAGAGGSGTGRGRFGGSGGNGEGGLAGGGGQGLDAKGTGSGTRGGGSSEFELSDIMNKNEVGDRSWERVENFEGPRRGGTANAEAARPPATKGSTLASKGAPRNVTGTGTGAGNSTGRMAVTATSVAPPTGGVAAKPGTVPSTAGSQSPSGIEDLSGNPGGDEGDEGAGSANPAARPRPDIGLGATGDRSIPVDDRRGKKKSTDRETPNQPEQLASRHWGLSEAGAVIGLEREVRIDVEPKRYVLGKKHAIAIVDTDSREDTFAKVVTVLDLQAHDWGMPPKGFFWKPTLRYVIADGGDANYERVQSMLERAGLTSTREYVQEHSSTAAETPKTPVPPAAAHTPEPATPKPSRRLFRGILR